MQRSELKILLLQIRDQPAVRAEEYASFVAYSGLSANQIDVLNVFDQPSFDKSVIAGYDALFVGGASEASVLEPETYPFVGSCIQLLQHSIAVDLPVFASCFGFQLAVLALGGEIIRDEKDFEMGTPAITLSAQAALDPVFASTPNGFRAVSVHKERAAKMPDSADLLAYTDACVHAFRVHDRRFWAFQFHPEVDRATLVKRLTIFKANYTDGDEHLDAVLREAEETPESNALVRNFVTNVLLGKTDDD